MNQSLPVLARTLIALLFIITGVMKTTGFSSTTAMMADVGFPMPSLFLTLAIVTEIGGGLLLLAGIRLCYVALALAAFLVPATLIFHVPQIGDPESGSEQLIHTLKNLAIIGGLLLFVLQGGPEPQTDWEAISGGVGSNR